MVRAPLSTTSSSMRWVMLVSTATLLAAFIACHRSDPNPAAVPCPDEVAELCKQWYGTSLGGIICDSTEDDHFDACVRLNPGALPAQWCCPTPEPDAGSPCQTAPCAGVVASAVSDCAVFGATTQTPRCVPFGKNSLGAFVCAPMPQWGACAIYSDELLCCEH